LQSVCHLYLRISTFNTCQDDYPTVFSSTTHVTITGTDLPHNPNFQVSIAYLATTFFKQTVFDTTCKKIYDADNRPSLGIVVSNFCLKTAFLVLASHKTVKKILNGDFTPLPPLAGDIYTLRGTSASHGLGHECMTLVADDYLEDLDTPATPESPLPATLDSPTTKKQCLFFLLPQSIILPPKSLDTEHITEWRKQTGMSSTLSQIRHSP